MNTSALASALPTTRPRRAYRSPPRERQARRTRRRILTAATRLFVRGGYTPTTMRAIAQAAGVSVPTVELAFGSKPRLLKAAIDVAIAGDDQPLPMLQREWVARALATTSVSELLAVCGAVMRASATRSAALVVAAFEVATSDATLRQVADELAAQRAVTVAWLVDAIAARKPLRTGLTRQAAIDSVWILMDPVVFQRMIRERGWSPVQFERWFIESVERLLVPDAPALGTGGGT